jgi:hypothetical protein
MDDISFVYFILKQQITQVMLHLFYLFFKSGHHSWLDYGQLILGLKNPFLTLFHQNTSKKHPRHLKKPIYGLKLAYKWFFKKINLSKKHSRVMIFFFYTIKRKGLNESFLIE